MATKYVSALNGQQMDAALTDMAYHTSEAFAIGERNGVPVSSGDVAYQNNAKYYAEQASADATEADAAAARAEAAVPPSTAGAVFFDRAQTLTDAQKGQAKANIGAGSTNPNLLDNAYFVGGGSQLGEGVFPINQRGQASYSAYTNSIDRWYAAAAMTVAADGISCGAIVQKLPQVAPLDGKTLTFSALLADGTMLSGSAVFNSASDTYFYNDPGAGEYLLYNTYFGGFEVVTPRKIAAVKLELGTVSTLANDAPPDFGEELRKCQRYFTRLSSGVIYTVYGNAVAEDAGTALMMIPLPVSMRATPTSVVWNNIRLYDYVSAASISPSSVYAIRGGVSTPLLNVWCGASPAMTAAHWLTIQATDASAYIEISAEL